MAEQKTIKYAELTAECDISVTEALRRFFGDNPAPVRAEVPEKPENDGKRRKEDDCAD